MDGDRGGVGHILERHRVGHQAFVGCHLVGCGGGNGLTRRRLSCFLCLLLASFFIGKDLVLVDSMFHAIFGQGDSSVGHGANHTCGRKGLNQILLTEVHGGETLEARFEEAIVDLLGVELHLDPLLNANGLHPFQIARFGPEGEAIQGVGRPFFAGKGLGGSRLLRMPTRHRSRQKG